MISFVVVNSISTDFMTIIFAKHKLIVYAVNYLIIASVLLFKVYESELDDGFMTHIWFIAKLIVTFLIAFILFLYVSFSLKEINTRTAIKIFKMNN